MSQSFSAEEPLQGERLQQAYDALRAAYQTLETQYHIFRALFEHASEGSLITDHRLTITEANEAAARLLQAPQETLIGRSLAGYVSEEARVEITKRLKQAQTESVLDWQPIVVHPHTGPPFLTRLTCRAIRTAGSLPAVYYWTLHDFRQHDPATMLQFAAAIVENSDDPIIGHTLDGTIATWNKGAERVYGYKAEEVIGKPITLLFPPGYQDDHQNLLKRLQQGERIISYETKRLRKDGTLLDISLTASPIRDEHGEIIGVSAIARDITERKWVDKIIAQAHTKVLQQRRQLRTVLSALPVGVFIADAGGYITEINDAAVTIWGGSLPPTRRIADYETYKAWWADTGQPLRPDDWGLARALNEGEAAPGEVIDIERFDGTRGTILNSAAPIRDENGRIVGAVAVIMDITERRQAEQQALELVAERERMRVLLDFVRDISHDFRTPLSTINTSLYLLPKLKDPAHQKYHLDMIRRQTARLTQLLDGLLTMTRLDSGTSFSFRPINLNRIVEEIHISLLSTAEEKGQRVQIDLAPALPLVEVDELELERALRELVQNAIQFTPQGGIITLRTASLNSAVMVTVQDTGPGIPPADLPRIFDRLYRADKARSPQTGGVGLGLAIAKKIIEAHRGRIAVSSVVGRGSTFTVILPEKR